MTGFIENDEEDLNPVEFDPLAAAAQERQKLELIEKEEDAVFVHLRRTKQAYASVFGGDASEDDVQFVLRDLAWFCKAYDSVFDPVNPRMQEHIVGRQSVFLRIKEYTQLDTDTLMKRYHKQQS